MSGNTGGACRALATAWAVTVLLAACGGDGGETATPTTATVPATTGSASPPAQDTTPAPTPDTAPPTTHSDGDGDGDGEGPGPGHDQPPGDDVPAPGTTFAGENISAEHAADVQEAVDQGHEPWRLDQGSVATTFVGNRFGWDDVGIALDDPHTVQVTDTVSGHLVSLQMRQPVREGETGIWVVDSGVWLG